MIYSRMLLMYIIIVKLLGTVEELTVVRQAMRVIGNATEFGTLT